MCTHFTRRVLASATTLTLSTAALAGSALALSPTAPAVAAPHRTHSVSAFGPGLSPAAAAADLSVKVEGTDATLSWTSQENPGKGWRVARDGSDSNGHGAWQTDIGGDKRSQTFSRLVPGAKYQLTVTNLDNGEKATKEITVPRPGENAPTPSPTAGAPADGKSATARVLGTPRSGKPWFSGAWRAAPFTPASVDEIGNWRGSPMDAVTSYSNKESLDKIANSQWNVNTYKGFGGIMSYNLTLVPTDRSANFDSIARGDQDWVWRKNAEILKENGRSNSLVNIGWEMNGDWWAWSATAQNADKFKAAFNRVASVMRKVTPELKFGFIIGCGRALNGQSDRLDSVNRLYPGDQFVDVVGCNTYDWWAAKARTDQEFDKHVRPDSSPGLADLADFARKHNKGMAIPEWGPAATSVQGSGDNPFFIRKMHEWLTANRDVVVLENYFMEAASNVGNSLINPVQMPKAAEEYKRLW